MPLGAFQAVQEGFKLSSTQQLLVHADNINKLRGSIHTIKKKTALVVASKEIGLIVNAKKSNYSCLQDQNAGQNFNIKIGNTSFEVWNS
jgi:hypothetical protein